MSSKAVNPENRMSASFEERSVLIQLIAMVAVLGGYLLSASGMLLDGNMDLELYVPKFLMAVVTLIVVMIVGHIAVAIIRKPEERDERDQIIEWRAGNNSTWIATAGTLLALCGLALSVEIVWIAHLLLLSLFLSEVVKSMLQLLYYRRGI